MHDATTTNPELAIDGATIAALQAFPAHLEAFYRAVPRGFENWQPPSWHGIPSEPFTPLQQICHVRDIEIDGYHQRFARTLREDAPVLDNIDGEALAAARAYDQADAAKVFDALRQARAQSLALIATFSPEQLRRPAHFDGSPTTLRGLVHHLCSHDQQHLAGLQWLLAHIEAARANAGG